jgi:hypothetical protein
LGLIVRDLTSGGLKYENRRKRRGSWNWATVTSDPRRKKWLGRIEVLTMVLVGEEKGRVEGRRQ